MKKIILNTFIIITLLLLYSHFIEPKMLKTNEIALTNENIAPTFDGLKIVHFSDLHYKRKITEKYLNKLITEINLINPDIVVFTGDLVDNTTTLSEDEQKTLEKYLSKIETKYGKYAIFGNHDNMKRDAITKIYAHSDFILLNNSYNIIHNEKNDQILISGLDTISYNKQDLPSALDISKSLQNTYTILLLHEPDYITTVLETYSPNLVLSGHSHGGQIRMPFLGKIYTPYLSQKYYDEFYQINNTKLYISYGIGESTINFRFLTPPSINFYRITSTSN